MAGWGRRLIVVVAVLASAHPAAAATAPTFGTPLTWTTVNADHPGIAVADVTGDGHKDVIATQTGQSPALLVFAQQTDGSFHPPDVLASDQPVWQSSNGLCVGDFNGDGLTDVAAPSQSGIDVYTQQASGGLSPPHLIAGTGAANVLACGDMNGDGRPDLVTADSAGVVVLLNTSAGWSSVTVASGVYGLQLGVGDLNHDGVPDIVLLHGVDSTSGNYRFVPYYGSAGGTYAAGSTYTIASNSDTDNARIAVGDVTGDGRADVIASRSSMSSIEIWRETSTGALGSPTVESTQFRPSVLAPVDFDKDGRGDVVVMHDYGWTSAGFVYGTSTGASAEALSAPFPDTVYDSVVATDVNGDGRNDLVAGGNNGVYVLRQAGYPADTTPPVTTLTSEPPPKTASTRAAFAFETNEIGARIDCSIDGAPWSPCSSPFRLTDVPSGTHTFTVRSTDASANVEPMPPTATWTVEPQIAPPQFTGWFTGPTPTSTAVGDVNGDGRLDIVGSVGAQLDVFAQLANGTIGAPSSVPILETPTNDASAAAEPVAVGEVNGSAPLDAVVGSSAGVAVYYGNAQNGKLGQPQLINGTTGASAVSIADMNGDGKNDIVAGYGSWASNTGTIAVLQNTGSGFRVRPVWTGSAVADLAVGDLNGDGRRDIAAVVPQQVIVLLQNSDGTFTATARSDLQTNAVAIGDVTNDGRADLVTIGGGNGDSSVDVVPQSSSGTLGSKISLPSNDMPDALKIADINGDGINDIVTVSVGGPGQITALGINLGYPDGRLGDQQLSELTMQGTDGFERGGLAVGDLNGDGKVDVTVDDYNVGVVVLDQSGSDTTAPVTTIASAGATADGTVTATFSADESAVTFECEIDGDIAAWRICSSPTTWSGKAPGAHRVSVRAVDAAGNTSAVANATVTVPTSSPPDTTIISGPSGTVSQTYGSFRFQTNVSTYQFACTLDGRSFTCSGSSYGSGLWNFGSVGPGTHTFTVAAIDGNGTADPTPASQTWTIAGSNGVANSSFESGTTGWSAPGSSLSIASDGKVGPSAAKVVGTTLQSSAPAISSTVAGPVYAVAAWVRSPDASPAQLCIQAQERNSSGLVNTDQYCVTPSSTWQQVVLEYEIGANGDTLTFAVQAASSGTFEVDDAELFAEDAPPSTTTPPSATITSSPQSSTVDTTATFTFASSDGSISFLCSLDSATAVRCTSPATYYYLAAGKHTFSVSVADYNGNPTGTPATYSWTVTSANPSLSPSSVGFGSVTVGQTSSPATATLSNTGTAAFTIGQILIPAASSNPGDFTISGGSCTANQTITPGSSCTTTLTFTPSTTGSRNAYLRYWINGNYIQTPLTGTGT